MAKKVLLGVSVLVLVLALGAVFWARTALTGDAVRTALAAQISSAVGQQVTIGRLSAAVFPRVAVNLGDVTIGDPAQIRVAELKLATDLGALFRRRIEHGSVRAAGVRIDLPLAAAPQPEEGPSNGGSWPLEVRSIDEIVVSDVEIVSGGRSLRGSLELVPTGTNGVGIRRASLEAEHTALTATGTITDVYAPAATLAVKAKALDVDELVRFVSAATTPRAPASHASGIGTTPDITLSLDAERARFQRLEVTRFTGAAHVTPAGIAINQFAFDVFGGQCTGTLMFKPADTALALDARGSASAIDVADAMRFAGVSNVITGHLSGTFNASAQAHDFAEVPGAARGTAHIGISNGVVRNLGLLRAVVLATSMRSSSVASIAGGSRDEPFSTLGATLTFANGVITSNDVRFESQNLTVRAAGTVLSRASTTDLRGTVQLSPALSQQAGRDLLRYTQEDGRVPLPVTIAGSVNAPQVAVDVAGVLGRALRNTAIDELKKRLKIPRN